MSDLIQQLRSQEAVDGRPHEIEKLTDEAADALEAANARVAGLEAARLACASEFPPDAEGLPDVGSIHANIRKLKSDAAHWKARAKDAEEYIDESGR